jgi:hypothetical protein
MSDKTIKMPAELRTKWLEALRSGTFKQTSEMLYNELDKGYCCLGVLMCVAGEEIKTDPDGNELPSMEFLERIGITFLDAEDGAPTQQVYIPSEQKLITELNDDTDFIDSNAGGHYTHNYPFAKIADLIEKHSETY